MSLAKRQYSDVYHGPAPEVFTVLNVRAAQNKTTSTQVRKCCDWFDSQYSKSEANSEVWTFLSNILFL